MTPDDKSRAAFEKAYAVLRPTLYGHKDEARHWFNSGYQAAIAYASAEQKATIDTLRAENERLKDVCTADDGPWIREALKKERDELRRQLAERDAEIKKQQYELDALYRQMGA